MGRKKKSAGLIEPGVEARRDEEFGYKLKKRLETVEELAAMLKDANDYDRLDIAASIMKAATPAIIAIKRQYNTTTAYHAWRLRVDERRRVIGPVEKMDDAARAILREALNDPATESHAREVLIDQDMGLGESKVLHIYDPKSLPPEYLVPDERAITDALKKGEEIPGARMRREYYAKIRKQEDRPDATATKRPPFRSSRRSGRGRYFSR